MDFHVYVLFSPTFDKIYIGFTSNLENRLIAHNHPANKGWSRSFKPWELVYHESFATKPEAMKREKKLKTATGRKFIREVVLVK
jgi:putative endonuclease